MKPDRYETGRSCLWHQAACWVLPTSWACGSPLSLSVLWFPVQMLPPCLGHSPRAFRWPWVPEDFSSSTDSWTFAMTFRTPGQLETAGACLPKTPKGCLPRTDWALEVTGFSPGQTWAAQQRTSQSGLRGGASRPSAACSIGSGSMAALLLKEAKCIRQELKNSKCHNNNWCGFAFL